MEVSTKKLFTIVVIIRFLMQMRTSIIANIRNRLRASLEWGLSTRTPNLNVKFRRYCIWHGLLWYIVRYIFHREEQVICLSGCLLLGIIFGFTIVFQIESQVLLPWSILLNHSQTIVT